MSCKYKKLHNQFKNNLISKTNLLDGYMYLAYETSTYKEDYCILGLMIKIMKSTDKNLKFMEDYFLNLVSGHSFQLHEAKQLAKFVLYCIKSKWGIKEAQKLLKRYDAHVWYMLEKQKDKPKERWF